MTTHDTDMFATRYRQDQDTAYHNMTWANQYADCSDVAITAIPNPTLAASASVSITEPISSAIMHRGVLV